VRARTTRFREAGENEPARRFEIDIDLGRSEAVGRLVVRERDGRQSERIVPAQSCEEALDALGLFIALAIDPQAMLAPGKATPTVTKPSDTNHAVVRETAALGPTAHGHTPSLHGSFGAEVGAVGGMSPDALALFGAFGEVAFEGRGLFRPSLRLAAQLEMGLPVASVPTARAEFRFWGGEVGACPLAFGSTPIALRLCVGAQVGAYEAAGVGVVGARSSVTPWFAGVASPRVRWAVAGPLFLELGVFLLLPVTRPRVFLAPDATVSDVGAIAAGGTLSVGVHVH
jgi:hypothetical protein